MKLDRRRLRLYAVTDRAWAGGEDALMAQIAAAIEGGAGMVQLREKNLPENELLKEAGRFVQLCRERGAVSIINDSVETAARAGADGVHVGQSDLAAGQARAILGPDKIVGVSAHNVEEALRAQAAGADYLGVGAAFATGTKSDAKPISKETIRAITRAVDIPVVAIGGVGKGNILQLSGCGLAGVAVVSALFAQSDVRGAAQEMAALAGQIAAPIDLRGAIFDLDGTLTDSMYIWADAPRALVRRYGGNPPENLHEDIREMGRREASDYLIERFHLPCTAEEMMAGLNELVSDEYRLRVPLKPGAEALLRRLEGWGVPCCIATASEAFQAQSAMERLGQWKRFHSAVSCVQYGGKHTPGVYLEAARRLGADPARTVVFEDALHAARTAKKAGFMVCGVYDRSSDADWPALSQLADWAVRDLNEFL